MRKGVIKSLSPPQGEGYSEADSDDLSEAKGSLK
jgi:hypothetical protein